MKMTLPSAADGERYAAKLLFEFHVSEGGAVNARRTCEERIIVIRSATAKDALKEVKRRGKDAEHRYRNNTGGIVRFRFVGVLELLCLGAECDPDEVWYELPIRLRPMERRELLIPPEHRLNAVAWEAVKRKPSGARHADVIRDANDA